MSIELTEKQKIESLKLACERHLKLKTQSSEDYQKFLTAKNSYDSSCELFNDSKKEIIERFKELEKPGAMVIGGSVFSLDNKGFGQDWLNVSELL